MQFRAASPWALIRLPVLSASQLGWVAMGLTLLIWAGFFLSLRAGAKAALAPTDLALLRFVPAALLLAPLAWARRHRLMQVPPRLLLVIVCGAGLPYFLLAGWAMRHAPVADGATLIPGTLPLSAALLGAFVSGRAALARWPALLAIAAGVGLLLVLGSGASGSGWAYGLFLLCSLLWSGYALALRRAGLQPLEAVALLAVLSTALLLPLLLWQPPTALLALPTETLLVQLLVQGLGVGLVSAFSFSYAVARLGAQRCALAGALTPVLAGLLAWALLGEAPGAATLAGMGLIVGGVLWSQRRV